MNNGLIPAENSIKLQKINASGIQLILVENASHNDLIDSPEFKQAAAEFLD